MDTFQQAVIFIAIVILIIILVVVGYGLYKSNDEESWPPLIGDCPDYWVDTSGSGANCVNVQYLGTNSGTRDPNTTLQSQLQNAQKMDFTVAPYVGSNGICAKYTWANSSGVTWDGITGTDKNPCITTTTT